GAFAALDQRGCRPGRPRHRRRRVRPDLRSLLDLLRRRPVRDRRRPAGDRAARRAQERRGAAGALAAAPRGRRRAPMSALAAAPALPSLLAGHWQSAWPLDAAAAACAGAYGCGLIRVGRRWPLRRCACFVGGLALVLVALQSGIGAYDEELLSAHMVQHMLLLIAAPLLLLEGRPVLLALRALPRRRRPALVAALERTAWLGSPLLCVLAFSTAVLLAHVPPVFEATVRHPLLHEAEHAAFLFCGVLLWWPLIDADPVPRRRLDGLGRIFYLLASMPAMALVGAWLNRAPS